MANNANAASALTGGGGGGTVMVTSPPGGIVPQQQQQQQNPLKKLQQQLADTESELTSIQRRQQQQQQQAQQQNQAPQPMVQDQAQSAAAQRVQYLTSPSSRSGVSVDQSTNQQQQSQFTMIGGCASPQQQFSTGSQRQQQQPRPPVSAAGHQYMDLGQVPVQTSKANTMAWQQQNYMIDSGIHSSQSTAAPSVASSKGSRLSDLDDESFAAAWERQYRSNISSLSEADITRSQRIRSGLMAETIDEGFVSPASGMHHSEIYGSYPPGGPPPQNMSINSAHSPNASFDSSSLSGSSKTPKPAGLLQLLSDDDPIVVQQAVEVVLECSKIDSKKSYVINSQPIVQTIVRLIEKSNDPQTVLLCAGVLHNISADTDNTQGLLAIFKSGGIPALLNLLESKTQVILYNAITTLHNLLLKQEGSTHAVRIAARGIERMVGLLAPPDSNVSNEQQPTINEKFLAIVCDCLQLVSYNNSEGKKLVLEAGGTSEILRIMRCHQYEKLLWTASRVLKVLSVCPENKRVIVSLGGMQILGALLHSHSFRLVINCLLSLRNLSDIATQLDNLEPLIISLASMISQSKNVNEINIICCILSNLMCNNQSNKVALVRNNGVQSLVNVLSTFSNRDDIVEPAICTLRHLSTRHPESETAQAHIRNCNAINIVHQVGLHSNKWQLVKASIGLFRNLALSANNHSAFRNFGIINSMVSLAAQIWSDLQNKAADTSGAADPEKKKKEDLLEGCVGALQYLARDFQNREAIRNSGYPQNNSILVFTQMLFSSNFGTVRVSSGLLSELTKDSDVMNNPAPILRDQPVHVKLQELVGHSDQHIASHSSGILFNLADETGAAVLTPVLSSGKKSSPSERNNTSSSISSAEESSPMSVPPRAPLISPQQHQMSRLQQQTAPSNYNFHTPPPVHSSVSIGTPMDAQPWNMQPVLESVPSPNNAAAGMPGGSYSIAGPPVPASHFLQSSPHPIPSSMNSAAPPHLLRPPESPQSPMTSNHMTGQLHHPGASPHYQPHMLQSQATPSHHACNEPLPTHQSYFHALPPPPGTHSGMPPPHHPGTPSNGPPVPPRGHLPPPPLMTVTHSPHMSNPSGAPPPPPHMHPNSPFAATQMPNVHQSFSDIPTHDMTDLDFSNFDSVNDFFGSGDLMDQSGGPLDFFGSAPPNMNLEPPPPDSNNSINPHFSAR